MTVPEYTALALVAAVAVVVYEVRFARTGLFANPVYWVTMAISLGFMVLVDGWLTKLSAPIVRYDPSAKTPWRWPWDIPVEDVLFAFALLTLVLIGWVRAGDEDEPDPGPQDPPGDVGHPVDRGRSRSTSRRTPPHLEDTP